MNYRIKAGTAVLVGALLIGGGFVFFPHAGQYGCWHSVERTDQSELDDRIDVLQYSDLSDDAKRAFEKARGSDDNAANVYGDRCPPEFSYADAFVHHAIERNGTYYELTTAADSGGLFPLESWAKGLLVLTGLASAGLGVLVFSRGSDATSDGS